MRVPTINARKPADPLAAALQETERIINMTDAERRQMAREVRDELAAEEERINKRIRR